MDGKNILNFCMENVPLALNKILLENRVKINDIKKFFFHQGSKYIIQLLRKKLNITEKKMPLNINSFGNTVSSSIPIILEKNGINKIRKPYILCGLGVGLSISLCLIR